MKKTRLKKVEILIPPLYIIEPKPKAKQIMKELFEQRRKRK